MGEPEGEANKEGGKEGLVDIELAQIVRWKDYRDHLHQEAEEAVVADVGRSIKVDGITSGGPLVLDYY